MKKTTFTATYTGEGSDNGKKFRWSFFKDGEEWILEDYEGYIRTLEKTWRDSVPVIHQILAGYRMEAEIS